MIYTNIHNLPLHVCTFCALDDYDYSTDPNVISATTLISPARAWALKQIYADKLTMDYSDLLKLRCGSAIHDAYEKVPLHDENDFRERRFYAEISGFKITGKVDMFINGVLRDLKTTSVWKVVKGDFEDYIKQLSIYRWLMWKNGIETPDYAFIDFHFTDWQKKDALRGGNYPAIPYKEQQIALWSYEETEAYIEERLVEFVFAKASLPLCTPKELWMTETTYAVMKAGAARATKVFSEAEKDQAYALSEKSGSTVELRKGEVKRCAYCTAAPFCNQCKALKAEGLIADVA